MTPVRTASSQPLLLLMLLFVAPACCLARPGFVLTAPKRLLSGSTELICLSLHGISGPARVNISLLHLSSDEQICSAKSFLQYAEQGGSCLKLRVPPTLQVGGRLHLQIRFNNFPEYVVSSVKEVVIQHNPKITLVETDKPVYKAGQTVLFRVLTLRHDLTAVTDQIHKVWLQNPAELMVAQWLNASTQVGLAEFSFQLSPEPQIGKWHINVQQEHQGPTQRSSFQVLEYVLPKFQVTVRPPPYVLADADHLKWKAARISFLILPPVVHVLGFWVVDMSLSYFTPMFGKKLQPSSSGYSYGQPVKGVLHVIATSLTPKWRRNKTRSLDVHFTSKLQSKDGCELVSLSGTELGLANLELAPSHVQLTATVSEDGTGMEHNGSVTIEVLHQALRLSFLPHSSRYFKPGLPYKGKLKVSRQDGVPAVSELVQVCLKTQKKGEWVRFFVACTNLTSDFQGFVEFHVPPQPPSVLLLSFVATAVNYQTTYYSPDKRWRVLMEQPSAFFDVQSWFSPSGSYLVITENRGVIECGAMHSFQVYYTTDNTSTSTENSFQYLVKSRGDMLHYGQVTDRGGSEQPKLYRTFSNILGAQSDQMVLERTTSSIAIHIPVTAAMSPLSHLLVYWVRDDGEVAAASHLIHLDKCFPNKVKAAFLKQQALPGEEVPLRVAAAPHSLCAVTAVDDSTSYLSSSNHNPSLLDSRLIFQQLGRFQVDRSDRPRQVDDYEYCSRKQEQDAEEELEPPDWDLRRRRRRSLVGIPTATYADSLQAFEDFGAVVISDLTLETRPCLSDPHGAISGFDRSMGYIPWGGIADKITVGSNPMNAASPLAYPLTYGNSIRATVPLDTAHQSLLQARTFFPETWLWELVHVGAEGSAVLHRQLPHTITDWVASTFCISPHAGLGVSTLTKVRAFQPFFLDFNAPYSVKSSEMVQLKVSLFNYLPHGLPVRLGLEQSAGVSLVSGQGSVVSCVQERTSWVHTFHIRPTWLGEVNITVTAVVDPDYAGPCGPDPLPLASDTIVKPVLVKPEGFLVQKTKSALFCPADFFNDTTATWQLDVPADVVPNSASATVSVVADIMGPTLENLDNLVQLPKGCGEQNMVRFTPNIHVINYMNATNQHNTVVCSEAVSNLQKGYQRQLNYRHKDGSYSAFGSSDSTGSMWLTAFVLKSFAQARRHTLLDEEDLQRTAKWITTKQLENGCFPVVGQVIHKDMRGGLTTETSSAALTAYVMSALLEAEVPLNPAVTSNAAFCLRGDREPNVYTLALTTNAFSLLGMRQLAEESLGHLLAVANADSDLLWWEAGANSLALDIETTAYALLSLVELGGETNMIHALKVVRWLSKHRNAEGGFVSTQDTVMALEALTKYAMAIPTHDTNLDVLITALDFQHRFQVRHHDRLLLKQQRIPLLPTQLHVLADGRGCAFVQAKLRYNVPMKSGHEAFELAVFTGPVASVDECTMQRLEVCVSYKPAGHSNMVVLEVGMVTGFYPDRDSLYELAQDTQLDLKRWEEQEDQVNFYFEHMTSRRQCVGFQVVRELVVDNPAQATVVVYDYYQSEMVASTTYTMQVGCKSEKLPNPQPDVDWLVLRTSANSTTNETTTGDTGLTAMQADSGNLTTSGGNSTPTGLNPQFVDVDHELATPQGQEGPQPVYVSPAGYMAAEEERSSCPRCAQLDSRVFTSTYCSSGAAYKLLVRAGHAAKVLLAMSPRRPLFRQRRQLSIRLPAGCSCPPLDAEGEHVLLLSPRPLPGASVQLGAAHTVLSLPAGSGRPEVIRAARRTCPA